MDKCLNCSRGPKSIYHVGACPKYQITWNYIKIDPLKDIIDYESWARKVYRIKERQGVHGTIPNFEELAIKAILLGKPSSVENAKISKRIFEAKLREIYGEIREIYG